MLALLLDVTLLETLADEMCNGLQAPNADADARQNLVKAGQLLASKQDELQTERAGRAAVEEALKEAQTELFNAKQQLRDRPSSSGPTSPTLMSQEGSQSSSFRSRNALPATVWKRSHRHGLYQLRQVMRLGTSWSSRSAACTRVRARRHLPRAAGEARELRQG